MAPRRRTAVAFMALWIAFWLGGTFVALYVVGRLVLEGELAALVPLLVWLGVAAFALYRAGLRLAELLTGERLRGGARRAVGHHRWEDDLPEGPER